MSIENKIEDLKGNAKEKVGKETGDQRLEDEGRADQASASVKDKVENAADKIGDAVDGLKDKFKK